jgi:twitching motility protein PilT
MDLYNLPNKRRSPRIYLKIPVTCTLLDEKTKTPTTLNSFITNINSTGVYFELANSLPLDSEIKLEFRIPKATEIIRTTVRVVRLETVEEGAKYGIGAMFTDITVRDEEDINSLIDRSDITRLLETAIKRGASDLHLLVGQPPVLRIHGELETLNMPKLESPDIPSLVFTLMSRQQIRTFEREKELDFGIQFDLTSRFRINLHQQRGFTEATLRLINAKISSFEDLNLPEVIKELSMLKEGLILISGPAGSGKSTTMAAMVEYINQQRKTVIITLERPIEYVHINNKSIIKQREIGIDTHSFSVALKSSLRQDPNIIVVGELDDAETIKTAITASEAGYLVIASFHAPNTIQAIDRLASVFPVENRKQILFQLANCLKGIISQLLIPRKDKRGRILAAEIVVVNDAVKRIIRNDDLVQIPNIIQTSLALKMQSMEGCIKKYYEQEIIDGEELNFYTQQFKK